MKIDYASYSATGGRPINEDSIYCRSDCFIVADGLGGHENGETASAQAVKFISEGYNNNASWEAVSALLLGADNAVRENGDGGKSTVAALFCEGNTIRYVNVGDSRVYFFRNGEILARSKDHSVCQAAVELGELSAQSVRESDDRTGLFKVLGATDPLRLPKPYDTIEVCDGDAFLLCSDGFWEYVYEIEMQADLLKSESAAEWLRHMLKRLLLRSENNGDNYSAVCGIIHTQNAVPTAKKRSISPVLPIGLAAAIVAVGAVAFAKIKTADSGQQTSLDSESTTGVSDDFDRPTSEGSATEAESGIGDVQSSISISAPQEPVQPVESVKPEDPMESVSQPIESASETSQTPDTPDSEPQASTSDSSVDETPTQDAPNDNPPESDISQSVDNNQTTYNEVT